MQLSNGDDSALRQPFNLLFPVSTLSDNRCLAIHMNAFFRFLGQMCLRVVGLSRCVYCRNSLTSSVYLGALHP